MKKRILSFVIAVLIAGLASLPVVAEEAAGQQVQQIVEAMTADGITPEALQAAVQANPELAAQIIAAAAQAVPAAERAGIIAAGLSAVPAGQADAVAKAVYNAVPTAMQNDVMSGAITAGLDPGPIAEAPAAGPGPGPGPGAGPGPAGDAAGSGTGAGTGAATRSRGGTGRGFVSPS